MLLSLVSSIQLTLVSKPLSGLVWYCEFNFYDLLLQLHLPSGPGYNRPFGRAALVVDFNVAGMSSSILQSALEMGIGWHRHRE